MVERRHNDRRDSSQKLQGDGVKWNMEGLDEGNRVIDLPSGISGKEGKVEGSKRRTRKGGRVVVARAERKVLILVFKKYS